MKLFKNTEYRNILVIISLMVGIILYATLRILTADEGVLEKVIAPSREGFITKKIKGKNGEKTISKGGGNLPTSFLVSLFISLIL